MPTRLDLSSVSAKSIPRLDGANDDPKDSPHRDRSCVSRESAQAAGRVHNAGLILSPTDVGKLQDPERAARGKAATVSPGLANGSLSGRRQCVNALVGDLTARELDVLRLIAGGLSNAEIARSFEDRRDDPSRRMSREC